MLLFGISIFHEKQRNKKVYLKSMVWTQAEVKQSGVYWLTILINILTVLQYLPPR